MNNCSQDIEGTAIKAVVNTKLLIVSRNKVNVKIGFDKLSKGMPSTKEPKVLLAQLSSSYSSS